MDEQQQSQQAQHQSPEQEQAWLSQAPTQHDRALQVSSFLVGLAGTGVVDLVVHGGLGGLVFGAAAALILAKSAPDAYAQVKDVLPWHGLQEVITRQEPGSRSVLDRMRGRHDEQPPLEREREEERETDPPSRLQMGVFVKRQEKPQEAVIPRLTIDEIVSHVEYNSYKVYIGRSLTRPGSPAVRINIYKRHFKFIGASQKGKSSMAAAFLEIITRTHDPEHVIIALLDLEDQTSQLFADKPHIAELVLDDKPLLLHARNREQVVECLNYIVALMDYRYTLSKSEVIDGPILLVYIEEFLALKKYLRKKIDAASDREAERKAKKMYADFTYAISEIASRGLKVRIQLLLCAQVDYRDEDKELQEALINVDAGMSFCVRPTAAQAAGFYHNELLNRNYEDDAVGQAVVEMSDCKDLVLAPQFDLEQKLLSLEALHRFHASQTRRLLELKRTTEKSVNENVVNGVNEPVKGGEDAVKRGEYSPADGNMLMTFTAAEEVQVLLTYAELLKLGKPVTRTGIRDGLGWDNKQYQRIIKPVCDKHKIGKEREA